MFGAPTTAVRTRLHSSAEPVQNPDGDVIRVQKNQKNENGFLPLMRTNRKTRQQITKTAFLLGLLGNGVSYIPMGNKKMKSFCKIPPRWRQQASTQTLNPHRKLSQSRTKTVRRNTQTTRTRTLMSVSQNKKTKRTVVPLDADKHLRQ